ncbi:MAG: 4-oxalocrotonate tautomerase family protein [Desulfobacterales bacterium]|nr:4-oxalocrotonate tautomerase family protein [Desulfobacterales bacterium]
MPILNLTMTREEGGATPGQKAELIKGFTKVFVDVMGRGEKTMVISIQEVETDNYGIGGKTVTEIRKG